MSALDHLLGPRHPSDETPDWPPNWNYGREIRQCTCGKTLAVHPPHKEGARVHVPYWDTKGRLCQEPDCEENHACPLAAEPKP